MNFYRLRRQNEDATHRQTHRNAGIWRLFCLIVPILVWGLAGCAPNSKLLNEVDNKIQKAEQYFKTAIELKIGDKYAEIFDDAKKELDRAQTLFKQKRIQKARKAADKSMTASQKILKRYYLDEIEPQVGELIQEIGDKVKADADNPLNQYVPELEEMAAYGEKLASDQEAALLEKFLEKHRRLQSIQRSKDSLISKKIDADVSFKPGQYTLSEKGKRILEKDVIEKMITEKNHYRQKPPQSKITITLEIKGYTDRIGFKEGSPLFKKLTEAVEKQLPPENAPLERRKFLNQRLSEFRAQSIKNYLMRQLSENYKDDANFAVEPKSRGMGETLPADVKPLETASDPQRRICKIYFYISSITK